MRTQYFSLLLGMTVTATATMISAVPARAASLICESGNLFNYDSIQYIKTRPIESNNCLRLFGERVGATDPDPQGFVAYGFGHIEMSLNSPNNPAPYYAAGIDFSPENLPGARQAATLLNDITGFTKFASFLTTNDITTDRIGFSFGAKDRDFTKTWNLGEDINGQNYFSSPTSTLEERIYSANPDEVESFLLLDDTKFITFGYSDIYSFLEYGATRDPNDDTEAIISNPFSAFKVGGLSGLSNDLADAFLADVGRNKIQLVSEDAGVVPDFVSVSDPFGRFDPIVSIRFPAQLRIVEVPEPSMTVGSLGLGLLVFASRFKNKNRHRC
ncbi:PEP-CTERM sorting domain-containing protein [Calothrix sp. FACHB-1219]|uniref:PEP-CTERM sorting domain-containing protein n=1 Tax=unclassified Calothrix TaxID=2619626 RepID=UPI0016855E94|nr:MULTISPECIES: PEP-CTERM sorting domain-containing protein [unclassified Calothrix]MBD2203715.1 PEP-CTERM sorting domain-containing protein [Calothrix sp. FACHB-168]MBD2222064.1 PEP-CTERM sorting domain-containing protein [Calothrix sp. FACHB-1219]